MLTTTLFDNGARQAISTIAAPAGYERFLKELSGTECPRRP